MKKPLNVSAIRLWAPKATAMPAIPALARIGARLSPRLSRMVMVAMKKITALPVDSTSAASVEARWVTSRDVPSRDSSTCRTTRWTSERSRRMATTVTMMMTTVEARRGAAASSRSTPQSVTSLQLMAPITQPPSASTRSPDNHMPQRSRGHLPYVHRACPERSRRDTRLGIAERTRAGKLHVPRCRLTQLKSCKKSPARQSHLRWGRTVTTER
jgi:hypothetical protein